MALSAKDISKMQRIIYIAEKLIAESPKPKRGRPVSHNGVGKAAKRVIGKRRTGMELVRFRRMLKGERKKGVPVAELARKHRISSAYIYQLQ